MAAGGTVLREVRIRNFRCLRSVDIHLGKRTLLIGENNSGKSSFLHAAIGSGMKSMDEADVFLAPNETRAPRDRKILIDLLFRPTDSNGEIVDQFSDDGPWLAHFGEGVTQDPEGAEQVAIRTEFLWDLAKSEHIVERRFLTEWPQDSMAIEEVPAIVGESITRRHLEPIELSYVDANRDIALDLRTRGSYWQKLVSNLGLDDERIAALEEALTELNSTIVEESDVLTHVQEHLNDVFRTMAVGEHSVTISPVTRHLRDLNRGINVLISTKGGPLFPLEHQGMGTRSLAALLTFRAYVEWERTRSPNDALHPFVAIEEPEAHLQPQAQRAVFEQLRRLPGQWIASTHSPYICSQANIEDYRHFFKQTAETTIRHLDASIPGTELSDDDALKIRRQVLNTRGDMLFSRGLLLFEGDTEEQSLPAFAERFFKQHPNTLGLSLIGVGGYGNYAPFGHRHTLETLLREHLPDVGVWAYGSRVNGQCYAGSDLDLVIHGPGLEKISTEQLADFADAVRDSTIPFLVEARDWARLPERFRREIERGHVVLREGVASLGP